MEHSFISNCATVEQWQGSAVAGISGICVGWGGGTKNIAVKINHFDKLYKPMGPIMLSVFHYNCAVVGKSILDRINRLL